MDAMYMNTDKIPGITPPTRILPRETSLNVQKITIMPLGGIMAAILPLAAMQPVERRGWYLYRVISGRASLVKVAAAARLEPEQAPKSPLAAVVAMANPPGLRPSHLTHASYSSRPMPPSNAKTPIRMNRGMTLRA